jgi:hypothetical protein
LSESKAPPLIKDSIVEIPININSITTIINEHYQFINIIETTKIYEDYKWEKLKEEYNKIKKKVNLDKKLYPQIIKIYGIVNSYYLLEEYNTKNNIISKLSEYNNLLKLEWMKIRILHNTLINKRKSYVRNTNIIKIFKG